MNESKFWSIRNVPFEQKEYYQGQNLRFGTFNSYQEIRCHIVVNS